MAKKKKEEAVTEDKKSGTVIKSCSCTNAYQDKVYGRGKRVCNVQRDKAVCTCCGNPV